MSEKDLNKKISDADLENVSGGVIEQGTGTLVKNYTGQRLRTKPVFGVLLKNLLKMMKMR